MSRDIEQGREVLNKEEIAQLGGATAQLPHGERPEIGIHNRSDFSQTNILSNEPVQDFDDGADELWSLYGKEAHINDNEWIKDLKADMDTIFILAGLLSAVLAAFVVPKIQDMKENPADKSAYYQQQSVQLLDRISQQFASVDDQIPTNYTPLPYPTFHPSASDRRVNIIWLISLVCSLSATLLATFIQQWARAYIRALQHSRKPLKAARIHQFLSEGAQRVPTIAEFVPGLIHISLLLFFWGLGDLILQIDKTVFITTVVPILVCACLYFYCAFAPIWNPQLPYWTPLSPYIWRLIQILRRNLHYRTRAASVSVRDLQIVSMEEYQGQLALEQTEVRKDRDVRALRWLIDNINGDNGVPFVLAIPGSFNQEWGRDVWKRAVSDDLPTSSVGQPRPGLPSLPQGITAYRLGRRVRDVLEDEGDFTDVTKIQRMRMRKYIETPAFLVCCAGVELGSFGEVAEMLSKVGEKEKTNDPLTIRSSPLFAVRWTCLSLVAIRQKVTDKEVKQLATLALNANTYFQTNSGSQGIMTLTATQKMDYDLKKAWEAVLDLRLASVSWSQDHDRAGSEIRDILQGCESSIQELENITTDSEAVGLKNIDRRTHFLQETMDRVTRKLTRRLSGVFFDELHRTASIKVNEAFYIPPVRITPILPQLIYPGQQLQNLCTLGRNLRDITKGQNTEVHEETLKSLEYLREIPNPLGGFDYVMERQLWRLLDLRDGGGLGFTIELFFLALRQLPSSSPPPELEKIFYTGTFNSIKSNWKKSKHSAGTQRILLDLLCDLVIQGRGIFSDFRYPLYIVEMLLDLVGKMVDGHGGSLPHMNEIVWELEDYHPRDRMMIDLRAKALDLIRHCTNAASS